MKKVYVNKLLSLVFSVYTVLFMSACTHSSQTIAQDNLSSQENYDGSIVYSPAELDQMLAPIALYPDTLLSHILIASTYPLEVVQAQRWSEQNGRPEGNAALEAAEDMDWDASVIALTAFPDLLERLSNDLDWLQTVGDAFLQDEAQVLASVQDLRVKARDQGSLGDMEHIEVVEDDTDNIVIETRVKEVVYVPYYDTRVVYGPWWWSAHPPIFWRSSRLHAGISFYWGPRIHVGTSLYFSAFHWGNRHIVVLDRNRYRNRIFSSRHVVRHSHSRPWTHNVSHRRGVKYRNAVVRQRYDARYRNERAQRRDVYEQSDRQARTERQLRNARQERVERSSRDTANNRQNIRRETQSADRRDNSRSEERVNRTDTRTRSSDSGSNRLQIRSRSGDENSRSSRNAERQTNQSRESNLRREGTNVSRNNSQSSARQSAYDQRLQRRTQTQSSNQDRASSNRLVTRTTSSAKSSRSGSSSSTSRYTRSSKNERDRN